MLSSISDDEDHCHDDRVFTFSTVTFFPPYLHTKMKLLLFLESKQISRSPTSLSPQLHYNK